MNQPKGETTAEHPAAHNGWDKGKRQAAYGTALLVLATAAVCCYLMAEAGQFPRTNGTLVIVVVLALVIGAASLLRDTPGGAWLVGILLVSGVPVFLLLAMDIVPQGDTREGIRGLIYLYVAGAFGGLVLELLQDSRHAIELPSPVEQDASAGAKNRRRSGPMWSFGFLSRLIVGGLAGLALVTVIGTFADPGFLFTEGRPSATEPDGLVWALLAGSVAPVVWDKLGTVVGGRTRAVQRIVTRLDESEAGTADPMSKAERKALTSALRELTN